jgi:single-strand DNA-binding protein
MAASFNKVIMVGTLVRDPEIRYIASGAGVTKFRIAVNPNKRDAKPEDTLFIDVVAWDKLAETCNTYLKKGMSCLVEGRLSIRQYDDKDGNKRQATEVVINTMQMLGSPRDRQEGDSFGTSNGGYASGAPAGSPTRTDDALDEEIPF